MSEVRPYQPEIGDLCGRCGAARFPVISRHYVAGWAINLCEGCMTDQERLGMNGVLDDGLYRLGMADTGGER